MLTTTTTLMNTDVYSEDANQYLIRVIEAIKQTECPSCFFSSQILPQYSAKAYKTPTLVDWFSYDNYAGREANCGLKHWKRSWSNQDHERVMELLRTIHELLSENGIEYAVAFGTLVGAYRHFDLVGWDDDTVGTSFSRSCA